MDGLFLAYLVGICGFPAQPPPLAQLALLILPDRGASSTTTEEPNPVIASPVIANPVILHQAIQSQLAERPVRPDTETEAHVIPGQACVGKLSKAAITEVVRRKSEAIRHCYEMGLAKDEHFGGTVDVGWKIRLDGRVSSVNIVGATKNNDAAEECLLAEIMHWEFPPSAEPIVVGAYPFVFDPSLLTRHVIPSRSTTSP